MTKPTSTNSEIVVGLDLGSTKVTAVVGEIDDGRVEILGFGNVACRGLRKGVVSNIEWTVRAIREAVDAAQTMAGVEITTVYVGVAGSHVRSQPSDGICAISGREVRRADLERVVRLEFPPNLADELLAELEEKKQILYGIAGLYEEQIRDPRNAIATYLQVLDDEREVVFP